MSFLKSVGVESKVVNLGNGVNNQKSMRVRLIDSINREIELINERVEKFGSNWYELMKISKTINGKKTELNESRFWRIKDGLLYCQLKVDKKIFKYGKKYENRFDNEMFEVEIDDNGNNLIEKLNVIKDGLLKLEDNNEMFVNEELNRG